MTVPATPPVPTPQAVTIDGEQFELVAFYYPGSNSPWDDVYNAPFMGNFWIAPVTITPPKQPLSVTFHTAEAAFQATKWWQDDAIRNRFRDAPDGNSAFSVRNHAGPQTNYDWAGLGRIGAMEAALRSKFQDKALAAALLSTADAYLLEHNSHDDRDDFWSDNCDGSGQNQLGLALMRLRSELSGKPILSYPLPGKFTPHVQGGQPCRHRHQTGLRD
jgi:predicted NAD-dependent protein-ADP-ribosyltransferase YbiA (DUF1768 family)